MGEEKKDSTLNVTDIEKTIGGWQLISSEDNVACDWRALQTWLFHCEKAVYDPDGKTVYFADLNADGDVYGLQYGAIDPEKAKEWMREGDDLMDYCIETMGAPGSSAKPRLGFISLETYDDVISVCNKLQRIPRLRGDAELKRFKVAVKTIEVRMTPIEMEAKNLIEAREKVERLLREHGEETDCGEVVEYRNLISMRTVPGQLTDPKGNVVLGSFGKNAIVYMPDSTYNPYVRAFGYDPETGEWVQGHYTDDLAKAWLDADPDYIEDACLCMTRHDVRARIEAWNANNPDKPQIDDTELTLDAIESQIATWSYMERCEQLMRDYIDEAMESCLANDSLDRVEEQMI